MTATGATKELQQAISRYARALSAIEEKTPQPLSGEEILKLLMARDAVDEVLSEKTKVPEETIAKLIDLDSRLQQYGSAIATYGKLDQWRSSLKPPESAWWWFFESSKQIHPWDRWDWVWDTLTAAALVLSGSFMVSSVQAFSVAGLGVMETFGTIAQAAGLAIVGKGALTTDGKKKVQTALKKLNIPEHFHSEAMFGFSGLLLLGTYGLHNSLPAIGKIYYEQGEKLYKQGYLTAAEDKYLQAIQLDSENVNVKIALGEIYESVGNLDKALEQYKQAVERGHPLGFNHTGRVYIQKGDSMTAETFIRMGLQRIDNDDYAQYQLHRNLGWALWQQEKFEEAKEELEQAIEIDKKIPNKTEKYLGAGMANCLLADVLERLGNSERATRQWENCQKFALPETLNEYKWFINVGERNLANAIDTSSVVGGLHKSRVGQISKPSTAIAEAEPSGEVIAEKPSTAIAEAEPSGEVIAEKPSTTIAEAEPSGEVIAEKPSTTIAEPEPSGEVIAEKPSTAIAEPEPSGETVGEKSSAEAVAKKAFIPSKIAPTKIEEMKIELYDKLDRNWKTWPTFEKDLIYRVTVDKQGAIVAYEPTDKVANDFVTQIPLPTLPKSTATEPSTAKFQVIFTSTGKLYVNKWQEE